MTIQPERQERGLHRLCENPRRERSRRREEADFPAICVSCLRLATSAATFSHSLRRPRSYRSDCLVTTKHDPIFGLTAKPSNGPVRENCPYPLKPYQSLRKFVPEPSQQEARPSPSPREARTGRGPGRGVPQTLQAPRDGGAPPHPNPLLRSERRRGRQRPRFGLREFSQKLTQPYD